MDLLFENTSRHIDKHRGALAQALVEAQFAQQPELARRYGPAGRDRCLPDAEYHLLYLSQAIACAEPSLFADYIAWAKVVLRTRNVASDDLARHLASMRDSLRQSLPAEMGEVAAAIIAASLEQLPHFPEDLPGCLEGEGPLASLAQDYLQALLDDHRRAARQLILQSLEQGTAVRDLYLQVFQPALYEIGRLWQTNRIGVGQEHLCTAATQFIISQLYSHIFSTRSHAGTFVGTCVSGELHELGIRIVADFLELDGWETHCLGASTPGHAIVQTLIERKAHVLGISATIPYHVRSVQELIAEVRANQACREIKILVGGYPFNRAPNLWRTVGADGSSSDARESVNLANRLLVSTA